MSIKKYLRNKFIAKLQKWREKNMKYLQKKLPTYAILRNQMLQAK